MKTYPKRTTHSPHARLGRARQKPHRFTSLLTALTLLFSLTPSTLVLATAQTFENSTIETSAPETSTSNQKRLRPKLSAIFDDENFSLSEFDEVADYISDAEVRKLEPVIKIEDEQYRNEIQNADGSTTFEYYASPIKFRDDHGDWIEIETSLSTSQVFRDEFVAQATPVEVSIPKELGQGFAYSVGYGKYSIGFRPIGLESSSDQIEAELEDNLGRSVIFNDTFDKGISKKVEATNYGVKDSIIFPKCLTSRNSLTK